MNLKTIITTSFLLGACNFLFTQQDKTIELNWKLTNKESNILYFNDYSSVNAERIPKVLYRERVQDNETLEATMSIVSERLISSIELKAVNIDLNSFLNSTNLTVQKRKGDNKTYAVISFDPFYKKNGQYYLIEKAIITSVPKFDVDQNLGIRSGGPYTANSVLATGDFYKLHSVKDGVYKITYKELEDEGILSSPISSSSINIYGNHNGMLPEHNSGFRYDDLQKNAIKVFDGGDNVFGNGDYLLFYAESPHKNKFNQNSGLFYYENNLYTDKATYFITTTDNSGAKRIGEIGSSNSSSNYTMSSFDDFKSREIDSRNLMEPRNGGSGKKWFGELFDFQLNYSYNFSFPNIDPTANITIKTALAASTQGSDPCSFTVNSNSNSETVVIPGIPVSSYPNMANEKVSTLTFTSSSNNVPVSINFTKAPNNNSQGWLDYIEVNARRKLIMNGNQLLFRDKNSVGTGNITSFTLQNATGIDEIWDITDPINISKLLTNNAGTDKTFVFDSDTLREFIAFKTSGYLSIEFGEKVENQNLHGQETSDLMIVYHPIFKEQVESLKAYHESRGLSVVTASVFEIYNEFSSGMQDISAIKTYAKMHYDRAGANLPKYLLLFGDGSFDYKGRVQPNHNFVPVWESPQSLNALSSYPSDDFYGILDDNEGFGDADMMDIAVGRLTVRTASEADIVVNKIINYQKQGVSLTSQATCNTANADNPYGDWRNKLVFVTDDVNANWEMGFFRHVEKISDSIEENYPLFNIQKLHMDAFKQQSTPGGERYPDGNDAIRRSVEEGCLIVAYEGHGGEVGWADERILDLAMINGWTNYNRVPIFMTATCEFTKFDDPSRTSAGEQLFLNPNGGSIALFSTTRAVFQSSNERLIEAFYQEVFVKEANGTPRTLGDIYMKTKNHPLVIGNNNVRRFSLIGDPALNLAFPKHQVITDSLNGVEITGVKDTLKALSKVTISGFVANENGSILANYNGFVYPTVYDKKQIQSTLGNFSSLYIAGFDVQNSVLYRGKATVKNGRFNFTFVVPKDIKYTYGPGKISYYAFNGNEDATGYSSDITIGGTANNFSQDKTGPLIELFLNNETFISGGISDESPTLLASLFDSNGINTTGNGIGHDLIAVIDENTDKSIVLNSYYESDADTYQKGKVSYPISKLTNGNHTLTLKAWDVYNNSSEQTIEFVVVQNEELAIEHVLNYPNPFTTRTKFLFEHNQTCESLEVQVQIFTISGKLVKTINQIVLTHGYRADPIEWDGKDDYGDNIGRGTYVYRLKVTDPDNNKVEKFEKLVILK